MNKSYITPWTVLEIFQVYNAFTFFYLCQALKYLIRLLKLWVNLYIKNTTISSKSHKKGIVFRNCCKQWGVMDSKRLRTTALVWCPNHILILEQQIQQGAKSVFFCSPKTLKNHYLQMLKMSIPASKFSCNFPSNLLKIKKIIFSK